ncbi:MAG TPA: NAD(P)H-hydrate dehydratase [Syntrophales bacterium]|nr:NAD(P)H-hydrate dehydratase [Syntrophales bacterium]HQG83867.1 NAD(P)H-hydrate dehydratase [Syntrophales bacterium]
MKVATTEEMRAMDRYAIETLGISDEILMENAGIAAACALAGEMEIAGRRFAVFCGGGNNGGDGFVVARKIHSGGGIVKVFLLADRNRYKGAARKNLDRLLNLAVDVKPVESVEDVRSYILHSHAIVDAIFGTGLDRDVEGLPREVIELINASGKTVLSLDIPSGVNGDTGNLMGEAIRATATVTFGLPKRGNLLYPGFLCGGKLYVTHISFPPELYDSETIRVEVNDPPPLPGRAPWGHKGDFGDVLFVAGAAGYYGAPAFSALSFLKAGGGYSRLAAPASVVPGLAAQAGEIVFVPQRETASGSIALRNRAALLELAGKVDLVVLGPGLSLAEETQKLVRELAAKIEKPVLIDGDGLTAVAKNPRFLKKRRYETVLTPHAGEMARITGKSVDAIEKDPVGILRETAAALDSIVVLKGAHTLIGFPDGRVFVNMSGNPGMATAGSGDVLTGAIGAMFGLGLPLQEAVRAGVFIHGLAGDIAAAGKGEDGITARDIMEGLPRAVAMVREQDLGEIAEKKGLYLI